jgi:hypothetical protein
LQRIQEFEKRVLLLCRDCVESVPPQKALRRCALAVVNWPGCMKAPAPAVKAPELGRLVELGKASDSGKNIQWTRQRWEGMQSHLVAGSYVKYVSDEGDAFAAAPNYGRLVRLKNKCESTDFFRMNHKQANQNGKSGELIKRCCRLTRKVLR